jgi:hypothetical protein
VLAVKLAASLLALPLSVLLMILFKEGWFALLGLVGLVLSPLYWMEFGKALRNEPTGSRIQRVVGVLMGVPQALFGLACVAIGLALIGWILYNLLVERQPEFRMGSLFLPPVLVLFGAGWVGDAFRRRRPGDDV